MSKVKEIKKMLQWMKMDPNEYIWANKANLEGLFDIWWTTPREDLGHGSWVKWFFMTQRCFHPTMI